MSWSTATHAARSANAGSAYPSSMNDDVQRIHAAAARAEPTATTIFAVRLYRTVPDLFHPAIRGSV
jgi:hypothetical protein